MNNTINLIQFYQKFPDESACRDFLQQARWGSETTCPKCGVMDGKIYKLKNTRLLKCGTCRQTYSVRVGTVFEDSPIPLQSWFLAIYLSTSLKKGISSVQLAKYLGITQKSAWHMLHRIRHNVTNPNSKQLSGIVEVDEAYIGGRHREKFGNSKKQVVFGAVERGGKARLTHVPSSGARALLPEIEKLVKPGTTIYSDTYAAYTTLTRRGYPHESVNHKHLEFARGAAHTNTIEGAWSHFKLSLRAIYIGVSAKHLQRYCDEFGFRYDTRKMDDGQRFENWFGLIEGKHLTYKTLVS